VRWQRIDRIEGFEPRRAARAGKALSFEECVRGPGGMFELGAEVMVRGGGGT
jgi:hypothetical protein